MEKKGFLSRLRRDQRGLTTVEYAVVLCLIAVLGIGAWGKFGKSVVKKVDTAAQKVSKL